MSPRCMLRRIRETTARDQSDVFEAAFAEIQGMPTASVCSRLQPPGRDSRLQCERRPEPVTVLLTLPLDPLPRAARLGAASGVEGPGRAERHRREHAGPYTDALHEEQPHSAQGIASS